MRGRRFEAMTGAASFITLLVAVAIVSGVATAQEGVPTEGRYTADAPIEATSLGGQPLLRPPLTTEVTRERRRKLSEAQQRLQEEGPEEDALIWVGRRLAYLGYYNNAIELYTRALRQHPRSYKLLRHRGHRYITVRKLPEAVADLERAAKLAQDQPDEVEPDGMPNELNIPTSTSHTNIYYHLGLAQYIRGNYSRAAEAYGRCMEFAANDDMRCAAAYWLYLSLRRAGDDAGADEVLVPISDDMEVIENHAYHKLLLLYKGVRTVDDLTGSEAGSIDDATAGYGLGVWFLINGDEERARKTFERILDAGMWPAFGYIAAEAEVVRMSLQEEAERKAEG